VIELEFDTEFSEYKIVSQIDFCISISKLVCENTYYL